MSLETMRQWWIDPSVILAGSNPSNTDLARLREQGFRAVVSLLDEKRHVPRYDPTWAQRRGWGVYSLPIDDDGVPSLLQLCEFVAVTGAIARTGRSLVFCQSGNGRSALMGIAYWIAKGFGTAEAEARIAQGAGHAPHLSAAARSVLRELEQLGWRI